jgi:hypothetical protein
MAFLTIAAPATVMAQTCASPTTMAFPDLPAARAQILPSVHRQLSSIGRSARANGCTIEVTCVAPAGSTRPEINRNRQCLAAAQALMFFETRPAVRRALTQSVTQIKKVAGSGLVAGTVYITLR